MEVSTGTPETLEDSQQDSTYVHPSTLILPTTLHLKLFRNHHTFILMSTSASTSRNSQRRANAHSELDTDYADEEFVSSESHHPFVH